jgi:hypothetical protein
MGIAKLGHHEGESPPDERPQRFQCGNCEGFVESNDLSAECPICGETGEDKDEVRLRLDAIEARVKALEAQINPKPRLHILRHGAALCGLAGVPADWPEGNKWVDQNGFFLLEPEIQATGCPGCLAVLLVEKHKAAT